MAMTQEPRQLGLPGLAPPETKAPEPPTPRAPKKFSGLPDRLFFGIQLDAEAAYDATQVGMRIKREHRLQRPLRRKDLLHVSLQSIGDFNGLPNGLVDRLSEAAASVATRPFEAAFDCEMSFGTCIVLAGSKGGGGIRELERDLGAALEKGRIRGPSRRFNPHVTLMYDQTPIPTKRLPRPVRWKVEEFVLIHSLLAKGTHIVVQTFPLGGGPREFTQWRSP